MQGIIFDIKEFAIYDGIGVRQTVFFKGCPLRCSWCHNPEGLESRVQLMVSKASCTDCGKCKTVCLNSSCIACGGCTKICHLDLRKLCGKVYSSTELANKILQDADYYRSLGGGVTFSGGEPLMQGDFLLELVEKIPSVNKAIETSGHSKPELFNAVVAKMDLVMMDVKMVDNILHKKYTGVDNTLILHNLESLCNGNTPFVIRIPVIPGVNDNAVNYINIAKLICSAKFLQHVELLPYHKTAGAKYAMVGEKYSPMFDVNTPVRILQGIFEEYGIRSKIL